MVEWFVTGTGTGVGKTTVACALLAEAKARGLRTCALKPAESGCARGGAGQLVPEDAMRLREAMTAELCLEEVCGFRYEAAVAPGVAARVEGSGMALQDVEGMLAKARSVGSEVLLVEGAGGIMVPLGPGLTVADLMVGLGLAALVVAADGLGTINHTVLTLEGLWSRGVEVAGVVLCGANGTTDEEFVRSNAREIESVSGQEVVGWLPFGADRVQPFGAHESVFEHPCFT